MSHRSADAPRQEPPCDVSIILCFFYGNAYINATLRRVAEALRRAPQLRVEILVVNDSPEEAVHIRPSLLSRLPLTILMNAHHVGIHGSRVHGLRASRGRYVMFLDQDDIMLPDRLATQVSSIGDAVVGNGVIEELYSGAVHH